MSSISGFSSSTFSAGAAALPVMPIPAIGKGQKAARDFEAQLIGAVLQSLEKTFAAVPGQDNIPGSDDYNYMGTQALASAVAAGGGFGIARLIAEHFGGTKGAHEGRKDLAPDSAPKP